MKISVEKVANGFVIRKGMLITHVVQGQSGEALLKVLLEVFGTNKEEEEEDE